MTDQHSPIKQSKPKQQPHLDFPDAMRAIISGKRVTKLEWDDPRTYLELKDGKLKIYKSDTKRFHDLIVSDGDLMGLDWVVLP